VEDSRQAVLEARAAGVHPFCLTVDAEEPEYLSRIFGASGHTVLRHPEQLPHALLHAVRQLLTT
jgi:nitric oxide reductase NorD protein